MSLFFVDQDILSLHLKQLSSFWGVLYIAAEMNFYKSKKIKSYKSFNL